MRKTLRVFIFITLLVLLVGCGTSETAAEPETVAQVEPAQPAVATEVIEAQEPDPAIVPATETPVSEEAPMVEEPIVQEVQEDEVNPILALKRSEPVQGDYFVDDDPQLVGQTGNPQILEFYTHW